MIFLIDFFTGVFVGGIIVWAIMARRQTDLQREVDRLQGLATTYFNNWCKVLGHDRPPQHDNRS